MMEPNENANMAMQRLKAAFPKSNGVGSTVFVPKKKNVRIKLDVVTSAGTTKVIEESKTPSNSDKNAFDKLLLVTLKL